MKKLKIQKPRVDEHEYVEWATKIQAVKRDMTLLAAIDVIVEMAEDSALRKEFFEIADEFVKYVSKRQGISDIQAVLLALFIEKWACGGNVDLSEIAYFLGCRSVKVLNYHAELEDLVRKGLLRKGKRHDSTYYCVPGKVMEAIENNETYQQVSYADSDGIMLFQHFFDITHLRYNDMLSSDLMKEEAERLFAENPDCHYVKALKSMNLCENDEIIITHLARHLVLEGVDNIPLDHLNFLFDDKHDRCDFNRSMEKGTHQLITKGLVEKAFEGGFESQDRYRLADGIRTELLEGFDIRLSDEGVKCDVIQSGKIASKELFFDKDIQHQLDGLGELLSEEHYQSICTRLKERGLRQGFASLFYGAPGTGKTESVLQLARKTGRDIMQINIAQVKSKWVGESEKNIKAIFDRYRATASRSKRVPILLFNEADAVIGKRMEDASHSVDKMENSMQNIILQEMESLNGIMIATTNLVQNIDAAFERRFLYKVRFEKPGLEQRTRIWQSMMPSLSCNESQQLATVYDFSGGQIENIARKCSIDGILYGEKYVTKEQIEQYCKDELLVKRQGSKIGFL